jgi:lysophospholipase L1-like esterase
MPGQTSTIPVADADTTLQPSALDYWDSPTDAPTVSLSGFRLVQAATNARLRIDVPIGCILVTFRAIGNLPDQALPISVYVDGVWKQALTVPIGATTLSRLGIPLDGAHHTLELVLSFQQYNTQFAGIYDVRGVGIRVIPPAPVARRIVVYGDSIAGGALASPNTQLGWVPKLRAAVSYFIAQETWSGRRLYDDGGSGLGFASHTLLADRFANLLAAATTGDIYLAIGINDVLSGPLTSGQFQTEYSDLLDKIHTRSPSAHIYCQTMLITSSSEGTAPAYRTAIVNAAGGRGYASVIDGTTLCSVGNLADGIHPNNTGHAQIATALQAVL